MSGNWNVKIYFSFHQNYVFRNDSFRNFAIKINLDYWISVHGFRDTFYFFFITKLAENFKQKIPNIGDINVEIRTIFCPKSPHNSLNSQSIEYIIKFLHCLIVSIINCRSASASNTPRNNDIPQFIRAIIKITFQINFTNRIIGAYYKG